MQDDALKCAVRNIRWLRGWSRGEYAAAIVILLLVFPFRQTIAPQWDIYAVDAHHKPLRNITVTEIWQQYSLQRYSREEDRLTDAEGHVHFPRRTLWSPVSVRFCGCLLQVATSFVHAGCGPRAYLVAFGKGTDTLDWTNLGAQNSNGRSYQSSVLVRKF
jgi:hypothetical protein